MKFNPKNIINIYKQKKNGNMIYQLAKTSPLITGQVKLDLITDTFENDSRIYVDDIVVSPIADNIFYTIVENQKNNSHIHNIYMLYRQIKGNFFKPISNRYDLSGKYLYIGNDEPIDTTYMMGSRRSTSSRFGKSFEFLLPLYVDNPDDIIDENGDFKIRFDMVVKSTRTDSKDKELIRQTIVLDDTVKKYITEYFKNVDNDLMYISYKNNTASLHGIDVTSGTILTRTLPDFVTNATSTERTMYEFDNLILRQFADNKMIARQMINLCFHFNFDDIITNEYRKSMLFDRFNVFVECMAPYKANDNGNEKTKYRSVEIRDIYSNYENISPYRADFQGFTQFEYDKNMNVFDYLKDNKSIDLMHTNKMMQTNFHFSYYDNDKIMFNLYNGFSPYIRDNDSVVQIQGLYCNQPDISTREYSIYKRNTDFIKFNDERHSFNNEVFENIGSHLNVYDTTEFRFDDKGEIWRNMLRYDNDKIFSKELGKTYSIATPSSMAKATATVTKNNNMAARAFAVQKPASTSVYSYTLQLADENKDDNNGLTNIRVNTVALKTNTMNVSEQGITDTGMYVVMMKDDSEETGATNYFSFVSCGENLNALTWKNLRAMFTSSFDKLFKYIPPKSDATNEEPDIYINIKNGMNATFEEYHDNDMYVFKVFDGSKNNNIRIPLTLEQRIRAFDSFTELSEDDFKYCLNMFITFSNILSSLIEPNDIVLGKTLTPIRVDIPTYSNTEIVEVDGKSFVTTLSSVKGQSQYAVYRYVPSTKKINTDEIKLYTSRNTTRLYRYDGRILPQFISLDSKYPYYNFIYRKKKLSEMSNDDLNMFAFYGERNITPDYKSIGYYTLDSTRMTEHYPFDDKMDYFECKYLNDNVLCFNERSFTININSDVMFKKYGEYVLTDEILFQIFKDYVFEHTDDYSEDIVRDELYPLYKHNIRFEYMEKYFYNENDLNRYYYSITYTVKI